MYVSYSPRPRRRTLRSLLLISINITSEYHFQKYFFHLNKFKKKAPIEKRPMSARVPQEY